MTMYERANALNTNFKTAFEDIDENTKRDIINFIIEFGRVAKFRCRSNTAYKNFLDATFKDLVTIRLFPANTDDNERKFDILRAV